MSSPRAPSWIAATPIAHRGLHDDASGVVENTLPAFAAAVDAGYAVELDVHLAADGVPIVFHDDTLDRLTERTGAVAGLGAAELAEVPFRGGGTGIPTLAAVLALVGGRQPIFVEVKSSFGRRAADRVAPIAAALEAYAGPVAAMSFDPEIVAGFRRHAPRLARGIVADGAHDMAHWGRLSATQRFGVRHLLHWPVTRPSFVAFDLAALPAAAPSGLRRLGVPLLAWTVRSAADEARAAKVADQIIFEGMRPRRVAGR